MITAATAGTLSLATVISVAGVTLAASTAAAGASDAYLTSVSGNAAAIRAAHADGASGSAQQTLILGKMRAMQAEHQQEVAAAKAAKARAAANAAVKAQAASYTPSGSPRQIAQQMLGQFGWSSSQFSCLNPLWEHESGWSLTAQNPSSGAYGIPQALPGSQMASAGSDWQTNAATQIKWGLTYIQSRYGSPCGAWAHEQASNWY
ncbi:MAG TPA: lytic transglycosylase domain-containing protein [Trebonia sp.]